MFGSLDECTLCPLFERMHHGVPGEGPVPARIMVVGEAPGDAEDRKGKPFYGPSGIRLDIMLKTAGLNRADIYVTNIVKHRPPKNRNPKVTEMSACQPYLIDEILEVNPEVIVPLGSTAVKWFDKTISLRKDHGWPREWDSEVKGSPAKKSWGRPFSAMLVPQYHPAASMYDPKLWPLMLEDFRELATRLKGTPLPEPKYWLAPADGLYTWGVDENTHQHVVGFDLETSSTSGPAGVQRAEVVGYSYSDKPGEAGYIGSAPDIRDGVWISDPRFIKVVHNAKFEWTKMHQLGIEMVNFEDTKLAAYILGKPSTGLKDLTQHILGRTPITYAEATGGRDMSDIPPEEIVEYGAADSDHTRQLWFVLSDEMDRMGVRDVYENIEKPLIPILSRAQIRGVAVDRMASLRARAFFQSRMVTAQRNAVRMGLPAGVHIGSRDQLSKWLEENDAPITARTEVKRQFKTDYNTLIAVFNDGWREDIMRSVISYFDMEKLRSFPDKFLTLSAWDGALHGNINQAGHMEEQDANAKESPATGRLSMSDPNLMQVPHHGRGKGDGWAEYGTLIRTGLVARPGFTFVAADFAQQEPRIAAVVAPEPNMQADFDAGTPIYAPFGEAIYERPITKKDETEWHTAKTFFLACLYGSGGLKLIEIDPSMDKSQALRAEKTIDEKYPGLKAYGRRVALEIREHGYVRDYFNRIRWFPGIYSPDRRLKAAADREAVNMTIQGPAASLTKLGLQKAEREMKEMGLEAHFLLPIHDEVVFEVLDDHVPDAAAILAGMSDGLFPVSMPVEIKVGKNLGIMEDM